MLRLELVEQMPLAETAATELRQRLAPVAPAEQVVRQTLILRTRPRLAASAELVARQQHRELVELVVLAVPQLVFQVRDRAFHLLELVVSVEHQALEPAVPEA